MSRTSRTLWILALCSAFVACNDTASDSDENESSTGGSSTSANTTGTVFGSPDATTGDSSTNGGTTEGSTTEGSTTEGSTTEGSTTEGSTTEGGTTGGSAIDCSDSPNVCPPQSSCVNAGSESVCECDEGFEWANNGLTCEDIDECEGTNPNCPANTSCKNLFGSFTCSCLPGFYAQGDGSCADINECTEGNPCGGDSTCKNLPGSYECTCAVGYLINAEGTVCDDIDECAADPPVCMDGQTCVNTEGSYTCESAGSCTPKCTDKTCGPDGCGSTCGTCGAGETCLSGNCKGTPSGEGDSCETAIQHSVPFTTTGSTVGQSDLYSPEQGGDCTGWSEPGADSVHRFLVVSGSTYTVTLTSSDEAGVYVVSDCANIEGTCLGGVDEQWDGATESFSFTATSTGSVYLIVDSFLSNTAGTYTLTVDTGGCTGDCTGKACGSDGCGGSCGSCNGGAACIDNQCTEPVQSGDTCANAPLKVPPFTLSGSTADANDDYNPGFQGCTGYSAHGPDTVVSMTVLAGQSYTVTMAPDYEGAVYAITDCSDPVNSCVGGSDSGFTGDAESFTFTAATTGLAYIVIDGFGTTAKGNFTLSVSLNN